MNIYLDIDGVLITKDRKVPNGLEDFLKFVTDNYDCYWLTTHCKGGANRVEEHIKPILQENIMTLIRKVKPNFWMDYKTDGINFDEDFIWLDDTLFIKEREVLVKNNALSKLELIDLKAYPNQLLEVLESLKRKKESGAY